MSLRTWLLPFLAVAGLFDIGVHSAQAQNLTGSGATFPAPLYQKWFQEYEQAKGVQISYQAIGSGGGIRDVTTHAVDFGASDLFLTDNDMKAAPGLLNIPMIADAVCICYHVRGVGPGLRLTGPIIAAIYLGKITRWNDPCIARLNPKLTLPATKVFPVHVVGSLGTTDTFTRYLSAVSLEWKAKVGAGKSVTWPVGPGGHVSTSYMEMIVENEGGIGYIELNYAVTNALPYADIQNAHGRFIRPSVEATTVALAGVPLPPDLRAVTVNTSAPGGYPLVGLTYLLVYRDGSPPALKEFLKWALTEGQRYAPDMEYAPLSGNMRKRALALVASMR